MKLNPRNEVHYRFKLAKRYLREAEEAYSRRDYRATVSSAQLCVENSAKTIISLYRIPSWTHDPSPELRELTLQLPREVRGYVEELADIVELLAPEHGRATYGDPLRGLTPWEIYSEVEAREALQHAKKALEYTVKILKKLRVAIGDVEGRSST